MSEKFAKKLIEKLRVPVHEDFDPRWLGDYQGNPTETNRTILDEPFIVVGSGHDLILGRKWFEQHNILVDCGRRRLLFPPEWLPDPEWWKPIALDNSPKQAPNPKHQKDVIEREKAMEKEDQRRRDGWQALPDIRTRIKQLEASRGPLTEKKPLSTPPKNILCRPKVRFTAEISEDPKVAKMNRALHRIPPNPTPII
ncbi:hypothetical protein V8F33_014235, partial [Rhypophila sp. PSN 637]